MFKTIPLLKTAKPLEYYKLFVEFEDGVSGVIDLSRWKEKKAFSFWNEEANFKSFKITNDKKIEWNDKMDMDPDAFYLKLIGKAFEEYAGNQQLLWNHH
ncbi:DUF2442 domain-containing protein [Parafilimonas sp.]|uniref:DUF2442 domain-containing protein n=1 Tax=Parafilimonas sp. TaxID=1969739 RepID=UPI0039E228CD